MDLMIQNQISPTPFEHQTSDLSDRDISRHADIFKSAPVSYSRKADKVDLLKELIDGFDDLFADLGSCSAGCQNPVNTMEEFEEDDGDMASNIGGLRFPESLCLTLWHTINLLVIC